MGGSLERPVSLRPMVRMSPSGSTPAAAPTLVWQPVKGIRGDCTRRLLLAHLLANSFRACSPSLPQVDSRDEQPQLVRLL